jgi:hypothetical protein
MAYILEILAVIGIRAAGIEAAIAFFTRLGGTAVFRSDFVRRRLIKWAAGILSLSEGVHWLEDVVKKWLKDTTGQVLDSIDSEAILHAGGKAAAKTFAKKMLEKYNIDCPITDFYSETIAEEIGDWIAGLINDQIKLRLNTEDEVFSTMIPIDNIVPELDTFLVSQLSEKLNIQVTGVLQNPTLLEDIKTLVVEKLINEFYTATEQVKLNAIESLKTTFRYSNLQGYTKALDALDSALPLLQSYIKDGVEQQIPILSKVNFTPDKKKIANKLRQRKYRETHIEQRVWIPK